MYLNRLKNFIITFFVILAIYQTARLWFEDFSGYGLFYSIFSENNNNSQMEIKYNLDSIIINKGNSEFIKKSTDIYNSEYKNVFDNAIKTALKKGSFSRLEELNWEKILSARCIIYDFGYSLKGSELTAIYNGKKSINSKIDSFDLIVITPNMNVPQSMKVAFLDTRENKSYEIELTEEEIISKTYSTMTGLFSDDESIYYISSVQNGFELFKGNSFLPRWNGNITEYPYLNMTNPMEEDGGVLLMSLEKNINQFFENPAVKWTSTVNDVYTYSDENTVVKYYTTGVLEYSNYKSANKAKPNFSKDYLTALSFIEKDVNINNEYYLEDYEINDDDAVFYFDYKINNHKIMLSAESKERTNMDNMIEVTVTNGVVSRYKRLVYEFNLVQTDEPEVARVDFLSAVDKVFEENTELDAQKDSIENIELCYNANKSKEKTTLSWFIKINGKEYIIDTQ